MRRNFCSKNPDRRNDDSRRSSIQFSTFNKVKWLSFWDFSLLLLRVFFYLSHRRTWLLANVRGLLSLSCNLVLTTNWISRERDQRTRNKKLLSSSSGPWFVDSVDVISLIFLCLPFAESWSQLKIRKLSSLSRFPFILYFFLDTVKNQKTTKNEIKILMFSRFVFFFLPLIRLYLVISCWVCTAESTYKSLRSGLGENNKRVLDIIWNFSSK